MWLGALLGGPATVTLLGYIEITRLRKRFRAEFPFHDGPLLELDLNEPDPEHDEFAPGEITATWSVEDEGLLRAYKLYKYLKKGNEPKEIPAAKCPVRLKSGEKCLAITKSRLFKWQPDKQHYIVAGEGPLVLTNISLIQSANGRTLRFRRVAMSVHEIGAPAKLTQEHSPVGIGFDYRRPHYEGYWIDLPTVDRPYLAFLLQYTYAGFWYQGKFKVPDGFKERARKLGKL